MILNNSDVSRTSFSSRKPPGISVEGWITDLGFSVRLNLGKFSMPTYEALAFWCNGARQRPHPRDIK